MSARPCNSAPGWNYVRAAARVAGAAAGLALAASAHGSEPYMEAAYWAALEAAEPRENRLLFYLRVAGAVWIAVEWVAAAVLVVGYYRIRAYVRRKGLLHA